MQPFSPVRNTKFIYSFHANVESQVRAIGKTLTFLKQEDMILNRSSHQRCSIKKGVLKNFSRFTWKDPCQNLFLIKIQALGRRPATLLKKRLVQVFSCEFCEISKNTFFTEQLWMAASNYTPWPKQEKNETPLFWDEVTFEWYKHVMTFCVFVFIFFV